MTLASSNRAALRYIKEVTFGTTPTTPAFNELRYNGESLNYNINNVVSDEIRADRMTADLIQVQADASGDINFELSYDAYDDLIEGVMADTWGSTVAVAETDIDAATADDSFNTAAGDFVADGIVVGQWIEVRGFTGDPTINGYYRVLTAAAAKITVTPSIPSIEAAGPSVTMGGAMIRNGVTEHSYSIQKVLEDLTPDQFLLFRGMRVGQMQLAFETGSILTGSFSFMGLSHKSDTTGEAGQTLVPASTNDVMNATGNVLEIWVNGVVTTSYFNTLNLSMNNNLRAQDAIGSLPHVGIALARMEITAESELYFQDDTEYQKYLDATSFALSFRVEDGDGNAYIFTLPNCKYETGEVVAGGLDQDIFQSSTIRALRDPTTDAMIQVDRFVA